MRLRFAVGLDSDLPRVRSITHGAVQETAGVLPDTVEIVVRSIWDQTRGHLLQGALLEARYRIADVRERTRVRSAALEAVVAALRDAGIALPAPAVQLVRSEE